MNRHHRWHHAIAQITGSISLQKGIPDDYTIIHWASALLTIAKDMREEVEERKRTKTYCRLTTITS